MTNFDPYHLHPNKGKDELPKILQFVGECNVLADYCGCLHPGDICHFLSNTLRGRDLGKHLHVYEDSEGQLLGLVLLYPVRYSGYDDSFTRTIEVVSWSHRLSPGVNNN